VRVKGGQLRIATESAAGPVDGSELSRQGELGRVRGTRVGHDHRGRRADGPERTHGERATAQVGHRGQDEDPPDVTDGVEELLDGADEDEEPEPEDEDEESDEDEDEESDDELEPDELDGVVAEDEPDDPDRVVDPDPVPEVVAGALLEPGCSRATTTPMNAAMPVATKTAVRVNVRTSLWARCLDSGVLGWFGRDMG
jgi:hypothetical protein